MQRSILVAMVLVAACAVPADEMEGGTDGARWVPMPLVDDTSNPDETVYREGNDLVSGIYFETPDRGFVVTQGANESFGDGGAVFAASGTAIERVLFSGDDAGLSLLGSVDFIGIDKTQAGFIALAHASDIVASTDGGASFSIARNGAGQLGIEPVLAFRQTPAGSTLVRKSGVVTISSSAPGPSATYQDVWAPNAKPSIPSMVPADQCQGGPLGAGVPTTRYSVHVSPDRMFIAYTSNRNHAPQVCISSDGGRSFYPTTLDVPDAATGFVPTGVVFTSRMHGITWFASSNADGGAYIKRTVDGGVTWSDVALPAALAQQSYELQAAFFAPDGMHGWLAGYDADADAALLLATRDGGATWTLDDGGFAAAVEAAGGDKLYSGFALDAERIWIGGARGLVIRSAR